VLAPSKCSYTRLDGRPCKAWAVRGSDPPACAVHAAAAAGLAGTNARRSLAPSPDACTGLAGGDSGDPAGTDIAGDVGAGIDIDAVIADLAAKQQCLSRYIDECLAAGGTAVQDIARLLALHSQNAGRLGRLLRDQKALGGDGAGSMKHIIDLALDELSEEWGIEL
jgi:hypothetical protein